MSYLSNSVGPSPFLTASFNHFHANNLPSNHPHYNTNSYTNSYTNSPFYLKGHTSPTAHCQQKYFPKEMINVLPGITNFTNNDQQKLLNPLNTYSGDSFSSHGISSPFARGQIYYGNKDPKKSLISESSVSSLIDHLDGVGKKENPFNQKYLLSQKNRQLENYALYSSFSSSSYELSEYGKNKKKTQRSTKKHSTDKGEFLSQEEMAEQILNMTKKDRQNYQANKYKYTVSQQRPEGYLVESRVDEKKFGSFGQGNEFSNEYLKVDQGESLIAGLAKMSSNETRNGQNKVTEEKSKREPVFIDSEDDDRRSGSFTVPEAIIEEINNPRIPSTVFKRGKDTLASAMTEREKAHQLSERNQKERLKYLKEEAIQVGKNSPGKINLRGKVYEKLTV